MPGRVGAVGSTCGCLVGCSACWRHCLWFLLCLPRPPLALSGDSHLQCNDKGPCLLQPSWASDALPWQQAAALREHGLGWLA